VLNGVLSDLHKLAYQTEDAREVSAFLAIQDFMDVELLVVGLSFRSSGR
jgi:hypothetical protein